MKKLSPLVAMMEPGHCELGTWSYRNFGSLDSTFSKPPPDTIEHSKLRPIFKRNTNDLQPGSGEDLTNNGTTFERRITSKHRRQRPDSRLVVNDRKNHGATELYADRLRLVRILWVFMFRRLSLVEMAGGWLEGRYSRRLWNGRWLPI